MNMKRILTIFLMFAAISFAAAQEFNPIPRSWKWIDNDDVIFS